MWKFGKDHSVQTKFKTVRKYIRLVQGFTAGKKNLQTWGISTTSL